MKKKIIGISICLLFITSGLITVAGSAAAEWWPMTGHDAAYTGSVDSDVPDTPYLFLGEILGEIGGGIHGPIAVVDGNIYASVSEDQGSFDKARVLCADGITAEVIWDYYFFGNSDASAVTYYDGNLYVSGDDQLDSSHTQERLICFDAETGEVQWKEDLDDLGTPVIEGDRIYLALDNKIECYNMLGTHLWTFATTDNIYTLPSVADGRVYFVESTYADATIHCISTAGADIWSYPVSERIVNTPTIADGKVYVVGTQNLYCLDAVGSGGTTTELWKKTSIDYYSGPAAVSGDQVVFGNGRYLTSLNANTGSLMWTYDSGHINRKFRIQPTIANDKILTGYNTGYKMIVLNLAGTLLWDFPLDHSIQGDVTMPPVAANGRCYLLTSKDFIYGFFDHFDIPPTVSGPEEGFINTTYTFKAVAEPFSYFNEYQYYFDFGDGSGSYWTPENGIDAGKEIAMSHQYKKPGDYLVKVKMRHEATGIESDWSEPMSIHIHRLKITSISGGMGVSVSIKNAGDYAKDVDWSIELVGGTIPGFHINKYFAGELQALKPDETQTISTGNVFALGYFKIKITAECAGEPPIEETIDGKVLFFYVII